ncbi:MAG: class I SAM-dependent methyltransferase [Acidobacteriota bacterium]
MEQMLEATAAAEDRHFWFLGLRRNAQGLLAAAVGPGRDRRIVDCGAGTGRNLDWLDSFGTAVGVELSPVGLRVGRAHRRRLVRGTVTRLPFRDSSVDIATSFDVIYCLDDENERLAVQEMWRVLKPGGVALFNVAALEVLHGSHSTLTMEVRRYSKRRLTGILTNAGFAIERMTFTNMVTFPITLAVRWFDRVSGRSAKASDADLRVPAAPINRTFDAALAVEHSLMSFVDLPLGTSLMCVARKPRIGNGPTAG